MIHEITVTAGTRLKRYRAGAMVVPSHIRRRRFHTVVVSGDKKIKAAKKVAEKKS